MRRYGKTVDDSKYARAVHTTEGHTAICVGVLVCLAGLDRDHVPPGKVPVSRSGAQVAYGSLLRLELR